MRRWMIFVLLAGLLLAGLVALDLTRDSGAGVEATVPVRLMTRTPTLTATPGWWQAVATWTPTPTGEGSPAGEATRAVEATATPVLDIPPVSTLARPTTAGGER